MEEYPIDDLNSIQTSVQKEDPTVKVVTIFLFLITFVFSLLCFEDLIYLISLYFSFRTRYVIGFELHSTVIAIAISSIPITTFLLWKKRFRKSGFISYLWILTGVFCLSVLICILGFELMFVLPSQLADSNPFLPGNAVFAPFRFYFDVLFVLAGVLPFLILQIFIRRAKKN